MKTETEKAYEKLSEDILARCRQRGRAAADVPAFDCTSDHIMCETWQALIGEHQKLRLAVQETIGDLGGGNEPVTVRAANAILRLTAAL